jgi:hypothetical protein
VGAGFRLVRLITLVPCCRHMSENEHRVCGEMSDAARDVIIICSWSRYEWDGSFLEENRPCCRGRENRQAQSVCRISGFEAEAIGVTLQREKVSIDTLPESAIL